MEKKELNNKLNTLVEKIKNLSDNKAETGRLLSELLVTKGEIDHEVIELDCGKKEKEFLGDSYRITLTDRGVLYHEYGGYNIFVTPKITALYDTLADIVVNQDVLKETDSEAKENVELMMSAVGWVLQTPKVALTDAHLTVDIATTIIRFLNGQYEDLMSQALQEETIDEDTEFKDGVLAFEDLKDLAKEMDKAVS